MFTRAVKPLTTKGRKLKVTLKLAVTICFRISFIFLFLHFLLHIFGSRKQLRSRHCSDNAGVKKSRLEGRVEVLVRGEAGSSAIDGGGGEPYQVDANLYKAPNSSLDVGSTSLRPPSPPSPSPLLASPEAIPCPPGYAPGRGQKDASCALQFFRKPLADVEYFKDATVSVNAMRNIVVRSTIQLGLFSLTKDANGRASWNHIMGQGEGFWATAPFHHFLKRHLDTIAISVPKGTTAYFIINNFDEPQAIGACPNFSSLHNQHPNVNRGFIDASERIPVLSMSKVRDCHLDLLIPHPDIFSMTDRHNSMGARPPPWKLRADKVVFRGSTTGMGDAMTNLRCKVVRALKDIHGFDVGLTAAIQTLAPRQVSDLLRSRIDAREWTGSRYILDVDGNAHSFDRPLAIARAGATMLRVNVFTDVWNDGLIAGRHTFDINPTNIGESAMNLLDSLREDADKAEGAARTLHELHEWFRSEDVMIMYLQELVTRYVESVKFAR